MNMQRALAALVLLAASGAVSTARQLPVGTDL
jgi:hypothetical protein